MPIVYRYPGDGLEAQASDASALSCPEPTMTKQSFKDDCDINVIMDRYARTGVLPQSATPPKALDLVGLPAPYKEAMDYIISANTAFAEMPAKIRAQFDNDPARFVEFCSNPDNRNAIIEMGLAREGLTVIDQTVRQNATAPVNGSPSDGG